MPRNDSFEKGDVLLIRPLGGSKGRAIAGAWAKRYTLVISTANGNAGNDEVYSVDVAGNSKSVYGHQVQGIWRRKW